ncbi:MAG: pentapeptide repeat-containing protein [Bacteroidota bacterium]
MRDFFADKKWVKKDYRDHRLPKGDYENCTFEDCQFQEGFLDNQHFVECQFLDCDLTNTNIAHTQFNDVVFEGCKLVGIRFETCDPLLSSFQFKGCNLSLASFYKMDMSNTVFCNCKLQKVDWTLTNLTNTKFKDCNLENAIFESSILEEADFTSAFNFNIDPTRNTIKKSKYNKEGLIGLLKKYDLVVV